MDPGAAATIEIVVPPDLDGQRADRIVAALAGMSRSESRRIVDGGGAVSEGAPVAASAKLAAGTRLTVSLPAVAGELVPWERPLTVRYESPTVLVVDKPPGLVVHPGAGHRDDTLANILIHHYPELAALGEEHRWGLVHRLDRDTSGLLVVGRSAAAHADLQAQLQRREVQRIYLALVQARIDPATGTVEAPIGRDPEHPTRMALRHDGRFARTHYRRLAGWDELALLEVSLETGRTHQIRVHMSSINAPLVGDKTYGGRRTGPGPGRVWLHASCLEFADPGAPGARAINVRAPLPADLAEHLATLGEPLIGAVPSAPPAGSPL